MSKPVLVIMAAGMGSRYGGLKQIDPVDEQGHKIIDFSIYDAVRAGFEKVIFIIKKENEEDFRTCIGDVVKKHIKVEYVFQDLKNVPEGFSIPEDRVKPWGTAHAILCAKEVINGPFAVINADDYYGKEAFEIMYDFLTSHWDGEKYRFAMVGYQLGKTLTENGYVSRGICEIDKRGYLVDITERTHIEKRGDGAAYTENDTDYVDISPMATVSMNLWGFSEEIMDELEIAFKKFLKDEVPANPLKSECYLPMVVDELLKEKKATVQVLTSEDRWFGVTYKEDKPYVVASIAELKKKGLYPEYLWK